MVGGLLGVKNIPNDMLTTLLEFDCTEQKHLRPDFLSVKHHAIPNIQRLIQTRCTAGDKLDIDVEFDSESSLNQNSYNQNSK